MVGAQWLATCVRSHNQVASAMLLHLALECMNHGALASAARANHEQDLRASGALDSLGNLLRAVASLNALGTQQRRLEKQASARSLLHVERRLANGKPCTLGRLVLRRGHLICSIADGCKWIAISGSDACRPIYMLRIPDC